MKNKNRSYQKLRVWNDATQYFICVCNIFGKAPYLYKKIASQQIASSDSIHRNIAEGYCRKSGKKKR